jgi:hypothetical protein
VVILASSIFSLNEVLLGFLVSESSLFERLAGAFSDNRLFYIVVKGKPPAALDEVRVVFLRSFGGRYLLPMRSSYVEVSLGMGIVEFVCAEVDTEACGSS